MPKARAANEASGEPVSRLRAWRIRALNRLLLIVALCAIIPLATVVREEFPIPEHRPAIIIFILIYLLIVSLALLRRLDWRVRAWGLLLLGYGAGVLAFVRGGLAGDGRIFLMALPLFAILLVGIRSGIAMAVLGTITYIAFGIFAGAGWLENWLVNPTNPVAPNDWIVSGAALGMLLLVVILLQIDYHHFNRGTLQTARQAANALAQARDMLDERAGELEAANRLLSERAEALAAAAEVARQMVALREEGELIAQFVRFISERFDLYHVGLFLLDEENSSVNLRAASSAEGQRMIGRDYRIPIGSTNPVGQAAQSGETQLAMAPMAPLPGLPATRWQIALPMQTGEQIRGILEIHLDEEEPPSKEQIQILQTLVNQLAVGLENARLFAQTRASLEELRSLYQTVTGEAWKHYATVHAELAQYQAGDPKAPQETWDDVFAAARQQGQPVTHFDQRGAEDSQHIMAVPLKLRGVPIGVVGFNRPPEDGEWQAEEINLAASAAERLAIALESARLFQETQRTLGEVEALHRASLAIVEAPSMQQAVAEIVQVAHYLGFTSAALTRITGSGKDGLPSRSDVFAAKIEDGQIVPLPPQTDRSIVSHSTTRLLLQEPEFVLVYADAADPQEAIPQDVRSQMQEEGMRSLVLAGLSIGGQPMGFLSIGAPISLSDTPAAHLNRLRTLAYQMGVAIENRLLLEETQQRARRLALVNEVASAVRATLDLDELMMAVYQQVAPIFYADAFFIALYDEENQEIDFRLRVDEGELTPPSRRPLGEGLSSVIIHENRSLLIRNFGQEREQLPVPIVWGRAMPESWLGVPMRMGDKVVGIISVQSYRSNAYGDEEEQLLSTIADQLAIAINNAQLFNAARQRAEEERLVAEVAAQVRGTLDIDTVLQTAVRQIGEVLGLHDVEIELTLEDH